MKRSKLTSTLIIAIAAFVVVYGSVKVGRTGNSRPTETQGPADELEVELVTLRPSGFEPTEITRPRGAFVLFVDDRTQKESSTLSLMRVSGDRMKEVRTSRKRSEWHDLIDLTPGDYLLVDADNSQMSCRITILP